MKILVFLVATALALGLVTACGEGEREMEGPPVTGVNEVVVKDMRYTPRVIEVPRGTTVTWLFKDDETPHDVKGDGFKSEVMRTGTFRHTFTTPGTYGYRCTLHPQMTGRVVVTG